MFYCHWILGLQAHSFVKIIFVVSRITVMKNASIVHGHNMNAERNSIA